MSAIRDKTNAILWVGGVGGMEADMVERLNIPYLSIPAAGIHGVGLKKLPKNIIKLIKGYFASRAIIKDFKPDILLFTGGYISIPMALASSNLPTVLYVPDIEPGLALRVLSRIAKKIALTSEESMQYFHKQEQLLVTGYPVREELKAWNREKGLKYFDFDTNIPVLLFMGGSSGSKSINDALIKILPHLCEKYQIIHLTGHLDWERVKDQTKAINSRYQAFPYLHEIGAAYAASDLVISRAGASVLGEYPYFGLPAILVPYPFAWRYQKVNAEYLVKKGAAIMIKDEKMDIELEETIEEIIGNNNKLLKMRKAMADLAEPNAANKISVLIQDMMKV